MTKLYCKSFYVRDNHSTKSFSVCTGKAFFVYSDPLIIHSVQLDGIHSVTIQVWLLKASAHNIWK
jgi:hypothetical protein